MVFYDSKYKLCALCYNMDMLFFWWIANEAFIEVEIVAIYWVTMVSAQIWMDVIKWVTYGLGILCESEWCAYYASHT